MPDEITSNTKTPQTEPQIEPISEPVQTQETSTAQIPVNEPLLIPIETTNEPEAEPVIETSPEELAPSTLLPEEKPPASSEYEITEKEKEITETKMGVNLDPGPEQPKDIPVIISTRSKARELLVKARNMIQFRKKKKLDKVMTLFLKKQKITNDEVEKFMHVSDATATRYLSQLEKEGKIKQTGKTGKAVFYTKI